MFRSVGRSVCPDAKGGTEQGDRGLGVDDVTVGGMATASEKGIRSTSMTSSASGSTASTSPGWKETWLPSAPMSGCSQTT
jgi:hypothetical protein